MIFLSDSPLMDKKREEGIYRWMRKKAVMTKMYMSVGLTTSASEKTF